MKKKRRDIIMKKAGRKEGRKEGKNLGVLNTLSSTADVQGPS